MRRSLVTMTFAALAVALPVPAAAQDGSEPGANRTVEGAQQFLVDYYRNKTAKLVFKIWALMTIGGDGKYRATGSWKAPNERQPEGYRFDFLLGDVISVETPGRCMTAVRLGNIRTKQFFPNSLSMPLQMPSAGLIPTIDWSRVENVSVIPDTRFNDEPNSVEVETGASLIVVKQKDSVSLKFLHQDKEDAQRAAFAMQFLADQCGFKTDTGF